MTERKSLKELEESNEQLRRELNDAKNSGESTTQEIATLKAQLKKIEDELAAAKAKPDATPKAPDHGTEKTPPAPATGDKPRERFGFW